MNRVQKIYVDTEYQYWKNNYAVPMGLHPAIISFLEAADYKHHFHADEDVKDPWASPRSWTNLSTKITYCEKIGYMNNIREIERLALFCSHVGAAAATDFVNLLYYLF